MKSMKGQIFLEDCQMIPAKFCNPWLVAQHHKSLLFVNFCWFINSFPFMVAQMSDQNVPCHPLYMYRNWSNETQAFEDMKRKQGAERKIKEILKACSICYHHSSAEGVSPGSWLIPFGFNKTQNLLCVLECMPCPGMIEGMWRSTAATKGSASYICFASSEKGASWK